MALFSLLLLFTLLKSFASAGTTNPTDNVQKGPGSLPAVIVLVISLVLLIFGSVLVTFHYCRKREEEKEEEEDTFNESWDVGKKEKLDNVENYDELDYDKMDEEWVVKKTKSVEKVVTVEKVDENSYTYVEESGTYV